MKLLGEDAGDDKLRKNKRSYSHKSPWVRLWIVTAGVLMNLFLNWLFTWHSVVDCGAVSVFGGGCGWEWSDGQWFCGARGEGGESGCRSRG